MYSIRDLEALGACDDARDWWLDTLGEHPVPLDIALAACKRDSWVIWAAVTRHPDMLYALIGTEIADLATREPRLSAYANVTKENIAELGVLARCLWGEGCVGIPYRHIAGAIKFFGDGEFLDAAAQLTFLGCTTPVGRFPVNRSTKENVAKQRVVSEAWLRAGGPPQ